MPSFDAASLPLIAVGFCGLCVVGVILLFGVQVLGFALGAVGDILQLVLEFLGGGPIAWCGCLLLFGGLGLCAFLVITAASALGTCEANPTNFCTLLGR